MGSSVLSNPRNTGERTSHFGTRWWKPRLLPHEIQATVDNQVYQDFKVIVRLVGLKEEKAKDLSSGCQVWMAGGEGAKQR